METLQKSNSEGLASGALSFYLGEYDLYYMRMTKCASDSIAYWLRGNIETLTSLFDVFVGDYERSFTTIRNPYDRVVSAYKHFLHRHQIEPITKIKGLLHIEFSEFVDRIIELGHPEGLTDSNEIKENFYLQRMNPNLDDWEYTFKVHTVPLTHSFCDARMFSDILRFENLEDEWRKLLNKYNIPYSPLTHTNKVSGDVYWKYYDDVIIRDKVADYYKEDLLTFDYKF